MNCGFDWRGNRYVHSIFLSCRYHSRAFSPRAPHVLFSGELAIGQRENTHWSIIPFLRCWEFELFRQPYALPERPANIDIYAEHSYPVANSSAWTGRKFPTHRSRLQSRMEP